MLGLSFFVAQPTLRNILHRSIRSVQEFPEFCRHLKSTSVTVSIFHSSQ